MPSIGPPRRSDQSGGQVIIPPDGIYSERKITSDNGGKSVDIFGGITRSKGPHRAEFPNPPAGSTLYADQRGPHLANYGVKIK